MRFFNKIRFIIIMLLMGYYNLSIRASSTVCVVSSQNINERDDSIKVSQLQEIVVEGNYANLDGFSIIFYPSRSEKNHSDSPASLIDRMHIPSLIVNGDNITTGTGKIVSVFVNGERLSSTELATFWPKEVKSVEYIEQSDNPKFINYLPCLNFITQEYKWGGLTRLKGTQTIPGIGNYEVSSKFTDDRWTFSVKAGLLYWHLHNSGTKGWEEFQDFYYNGEFINSLKKTLHETGVGRQDNWTTAFNIRYSDDRSTLNHTIGFNVQKNPNSYSNVSSCWDLLDFESTESSFHSNSMGKMPSIMANYDFTLSNKSSLDISWGYKHIINKNYDEFRGFNNLNFYNKIKENGDVGLFEMGYSLAMSEKLKVGSTLGYVYESYHTTYEGTGDSAFKTWKSDANAKINLSWQLSDYLSLTGTPGISWNLYRSGTTGINRLWHPNLELDFSFTNRSRFMGGVNVYYFKFSPGVSVLADVKIRENEILWLQGNPSLKPNENWNLQLNGMWFVNRHIMLSTDLSYWIKINEEYSNYIPNNIDGGIIRIYENAPTSHRFNWQVNLRYSVRNLTFWTKPDLTYFIAGQEKSTHLLSPRLMAGIEYYVKNFMISGYYDTRYKVLSEGGMSKYTHPENWMISISYSNGNIMALVRGKNLFKKNLDNKMEIQSSHFIQNVLSWQQGRQLEISLTYTFGYGKRVNRNVDFQTNGAIDSSILVK